MLYTTPNWSAAMVEQFDIAGETIHISALSMHPPKIGIETPHTKFFASLAAAARRGVRVKVWLAAPHANHPAAALNEATRRALLAMGIECRLHGSGRLLHAKTVIIDTVSIWVGSGNFTAAAMHSNHECYMNSTDAEAARRWANYLEAL